MTCAATSATARRYGGTRLRSLARIGLMGLGLAFAASVALAEAPSSWSRAWPDTDFSQAKVSLDEIISGGPPKDGIPSIETPRFARADRLETPPASTAPVLSVEVGGEAKAYPLSILIWHEIVNDTVGGVPVAVTYCPLCNSGVVFERRVGGEVTTFGTTGKLRHSDLVMYDRATESWWQQYEGRAIVGARAGEELKKLPSRLESFADYQRRRPQGLVLLPPTDTGRGYGRNPYAGYDSSGRPFLYQGDYDGPGSPLMRVVAIEGEDEAWSFERLRRVGEVETGDMVIRWRAGQNSALDAGRIAAGRDVGTVTVQRRLPDGETEDIVYDVPFAFAFRAFNPEAPIHHVE